MKYKWEADAWFIAIAIALALFATAAVREERNAREASHSELLGMICQQSGGEQGCPGLAGHEACPAVMEGLVP